MLPSPPLPLLVSQLGILSTVSKSHVEFLGYHLPASYMGLYDPDPPSALLMPHTSGYTAERRPPYRFAGTLSVLMTLVHRPVHISLRMRVSLTPAGRFFVHPRKSIYPSTNTMSWAHDCPRLPREPQPSPGSDPSHPSPRLPTRPGRASRRGRRGCPPLLSSPTQRTDTDSYNNTP